ncbi:polymorphic toxin-type HINT domain-containing protein [Streptomyces sp. NBC_00102]|uniref:polymorphic toxin-type HINT domain-containing protein n=1 Tax=Streptomyces sp. NBC_00102 TaxID=2975652 RepID=UPI0022549942|nr:polymorphic toxin-type HINT domain-containing protein [Streptomyces sp. NBC_00102]MCX5400940.1 polymorphic toxin-type HINT domain-containing protein [Streptomyces sp. NBC_00102]
MYSIRTGRRSAGSRAAVSAAIVLAIAASTVGTTTGKAHAAVPSQAQAATSAEADLETREQAMSDAADARAEQAMFARIMHSGGPAMKANAGQWLAGRDEGPWPGWNVFLGSRSRDIVLDEDGDETDGSGLGEGIGPVAQSAQATMANGQLHVGMLTRDGSVYDDVRYPDGTWTGPILIDGGSGTTAIATTALPNGELHFELLSADGRVTDRTYQPDAYPGYFMLGGGVRKVLFDSLPGKVKSLAVTGTSANELTLAMLTGDGKVWGNVRHSDGSWSGTAAIDAGTAPSAALALATTASDQVHLEMLGTDHTVRDRVRGTNGTWAAATVVDSTGKARALSAVAVPTERLHVATLTDTGTVTDRTLQDNGSWTASTVTAPHATALSLGAQPTGELHVQATADDGRLWSTTRATSGSWSAPYVVDGAFGHAKDLQLTTLPNGDLHELTLADDGTVRDQKRGASADTWTSALSGSVVVDGSGKARAVAAASTSNGDVHAVVIDDSNTVRDYVGHPDGSWAAPAVADQSGSARAVSAVGTPDGELHIGVLKADGTVQDTVRHTDGSWTSAAVTTPRADMVALAATPAGELHVLVSGDGDKVWDTVRSTDGTWAAAKAASDGSYKADAIAANGLSDGRVRLVALDSAAGTYSGHLRGTNGKWSVDVGQLGWPLAYAKTVSVTQLANGDEHINEFSEPQVDDAFTVDDRTASAYDSSREASDEGLEAFIAPYATSSDHALPQYDTDVTDFMSSAGMFQRDWANLWVTPPVVKASQEAQDRVTEIVQELIAENDGQDPYGMYTMLGSTTNNGSADDVRRFIQYHGLPTVAPPKGSPEFRVEVEALKARWSSGDTSNPTDWNHVLVEVEETASSEWLAEQAAQAEPRNDIVDAESEALTSLETGARAMHEALGYGWAANRLLTWQANPSLRKTGTGAKTTAQAVADLATVKELVTAQAQVARKAANDAATAEAKADAAVEAAKTIARHDGTPLGRGLYYAQQSAQVTKASAAAALATANALDTAVAATDASAADSATLLANAQAQAAAARAEFLRESAEQSAKDAADLAADAKKRADEAAAAAAEVADAKATAVQAQADATAANTRAKTAAANAETERQNAATAKAKAQTERDTAGEALKKALDQGKEAATKRTASNTAGSDARKLASAAQQAAAKAAVARDNAASAQRKKDVAAANAQALAAAAVAAEGTSSAAEAKAAADRAAEAAEQARTVAETAATDAQSTSEASVAARKAATESAAAAARSTTWAADADANALITFHAAMSAESAAATAIDEAHTAAQKSVDAAGDATDAAQAALAAKSKAVEAGQQVEAALSASADAAGRAYAAGQAADVTRAAAATVAAPAASAIELSAPYAETDSSAGLATLVSKSAQSLAEQQTAAADANAAQAAAVAQEAQDAADRATGDGKRAAQAAADAAASAAEAAASAEAAQKSSTDAENDAKATGDASVKVAELDTETQALAKTASASAQAATADAQAADSAASEGEKDAAAAAATAASAGEDAANAQKVADKAAEDATAAEKAAASASEDATKAEDAAAAAEEQLRSDEAALAAQVAAAQAAAQAKHDLDARAKLMDDQASIRIGRENLAYLLHVGGVASKTLAATRLAGSGQIGTTTNLFDQDVWDAWDADVQEARDQSEGMSSRTDERQETVWKYFTSDFANTEPQYDTAVTSFLNPGTVYQRIGSAVGWGRLAQVPQASPAAQAKAAEILQEKIDAGDWYGWWQLMLDNQDLRGSADDVRRLIQYKGYPTVAPEKGTAEFDIEVERLKTRWANGDPTNPWDPYQVMVEVEEVASAQWEAEYAAQAGDRNKIANAEIKALKALQSSAVAMHDALGNAWVANNLMEAEADPNSAWNTFIKDWPTTMGGNFSSDGKPVSVTADLAALKDRVDALSATATQNAKDAQAAADAVVAAEDEAAATAEAGGVPEGRALAYANQSAQVTKSAAAATQATSLAMKTAVAATNATVADSAALLANASAQAHAARAAFLRETAQDSAEKAEADAVAAHGKAVAAADAAAIVAADKAKIGPLETSSKAAAATAKSAAATADSEAQKAATARATAESERDKAEAADADAQAQADIAAEHEANAASEADRAAGDEDTAAKAEQDAAAAKSRATAANKAMDQARAKAAAADAAAAAAVGTSAADDAAAAAKQARLEANAAALAADQANNDALDAGAAAVAARAAATVSTAAAEKATSAAKVADKAAAQTSANAAEGHALAAEAIEQAGVAAQNSDAAQALSKDAAKEAENAKVAAEGARNEADGAASDSATATGQAHAAAQQAEIARDTANAVTAPADQAIELGIAFAATDATAGLSVVVSDTAKTLAEQEVEVAELRADEAEAFAEAAQDAADRADADAKLAAQAAADAAASAARAAREAANALKSATQAASDAKEVKAGSERLDALNSQAQNSAWEANASASDARDDASAARSAADDSELDAASARGAADRAQTSADNASDSADEAEVSSRLAAEHAANAQADADESAKIAAATGQLEEDRTTTSGQPAGGGEVDGEYPGVVVEPVDLKQTAQATDQCRATSQILHCSMPVDVHITGTAMFFLVTCADPNATASQCIASGHYEKDYLDKAKIDFTDHRVVDVNVWEFDVNLAKSIGYALISDFVGCAKHFDLGSSDCQWAIASIVVPAALKAVVKGAAALRMAMAIGDLAGTEAAMNVLSNLARTGAINAITFRNFRNAAMLSRIRSIAVGLTCVNPAHSFPAGTRVLMADGSTRPIEEVRVGDEVRSATAGGASEPRSVEHTFVTQTDTEFTDLTVDTADGPRVVTSTQNHPYYDVTEGVFVDAAELKVGDLLQSVGGRTATVGAVRNYTGAMVTYDLTVSGLHTYHVVAGATPVLVHNNACEEVAMDTNALISALFQGKEAEVDAAIAGRRPVISPQAFKEVTVDGGNPEKVVLDWLEARGGRIGAEANVDAAQAFQEYLRELWKGANKPVLKDDDALVLASAFEEGLPIITNDQQFYKAISRFDYPNERY